MEGAHETDRHVNEQKTFTKRITIVDITALNNPIEKIGCIDQYIVCVEYFSLLSAEAAMISLDGTVVGGEKIKITVDSYVTESYVTERHNGDVFEIMKDEVNQIKNKGDCYENDDNGYNDDEQRNTENKNNKIIAMKLIQRFPPKNFEDNINYNKNIANFNTNNTNYNNNVNNTIENLCNTNNDIENDSIDNNDIMKEKDKIYENMKNENPSQPVSLYKVSCCINALNCCVNYLCLRGWFYVFYVGHVDKIMKPFSML
jgi:hypothetical protein